MNTYILKPLSSTAAVHAIIVILIFTCSALGQDKKHEESFRVEGAVKDVFILGTRTAQVIPVGYDVRYGVVIHVISVNQKYDDFKAGSDIILAIHSPSFTFSGDWEKNKVYDFFLKRKVEDGKVSYYLSEVKSNKH